MGSCVNAAALAAAALPRGKGGGNHPHAPGISFWGGYIATRNQEPGSRRSKITTTCQKPASGGGNHHDTPENSFWGGGNHHYTLENSFTGAYIATTHQEPASGGG